MLPQGSCALMSSESVPDIYSNTGSSAFLTSPTLSLCRLACVHWQRLSDVYRRRANSPGSKPTSAPGFQKYYDSPSDVSCEALIFVTYLKRITKACLFKELTPAFAFSTSDLTWQSSLCPNCLHYVNNKGLRVILCYLGVGAKIM